MTFNTWRAREVGGVIIQMLCLSDILKKLVDLAGKGTFCYRFLKSIICLYNCGDWRFLILQSHLHTRNVEFQLKNGHKNNATAKYSECNMSVIQRKNAQICNITYDSGSSSILEMKIENLAWHQINTCTLWHFRQSKRQLFCSSHPSCHISIAFTYVPYLCQSCLRKFLIIIFQHIFTHIFNSRDGLTCLNYTDSSMLNQMSKICFFVFIWSYCPMENNHLSLLYTCMKNREPLHGMIKPQNLHNSRKARGVVMYVSLLFSWGYV